MIWGIVMFFLIPIKIIVALWIIMQVYRIFFGL
jgi:hypothetical protein